VQRFFADCRRDDRAPIRKVGALLRAAFERQHGRAPRDCREWACWARSPPGQQVVTKLDNAAAIGVQLEDLKT
jgi:hypothetical protein